MNSGNKSFFNLILPIASAIIFWSIIGIVFDYYYDLNDDVMIKDIISGIYTGTPSPYNNQMMYPVSLLFAGLYTLLPRVPWFGIMEIIAFMLSYILVGYRVIACLEKKIVKVIYMFFQTIIWAGCYLWELTIIQYTVVCGILCLAATVWVLTVGDIGITKDTISGSKNEKLIIIIASLKEYWPAILLAVIAFNIRSEMFLLMCPFMAMAGIYVWLNEKSIADGGKGIFSPYNIVKYSTIVFSIGILIVITLLADKLAYSSGDWKEYRKFFDARTEVYDFTGIPDYEANEDFYKSSNISRDQYELLCDYNFELDQGITSDTLITIAEYVKSGKALKADGSAMSSSSRTVKTAIGEYVRNALKWYRNNGVIDSPFADDSSQLSPMNIIVIVLYISLFFICIYTRVWKDIFSILIFVALRSIAWIYIYYKGRLVPRITHPMLLIEITILMMLSIVFIKNCQDRGSLLVRGTASLALVLVFVIALLNIPIQSSEITGKQEIRNKLNKDIIALNRTINENPANYYYLDVYSTVSYTEAIFGQDMISKKNQQLAGGWIAKSPLDISKSSANYDAYCWVVKGDNGEFLIGTNY